MRHLQYTAVEIYPGVGERLFDHLADVTGQQDSRLAA